MYIKKAYSTLTEYCIHELGYGDSSAGRRVRAARIMAEYQMPRTIMDQAKPTMVRKLVPVQRALVGTG